MIEFTYSRTDVPALAGLHARAFPGFFLSGLGPQFLRQLYRGYIEDPTSIISLARGQDGQIIGICVGTLQPLGFYRRLLKRQFFGLCMASGLAAIRNPRALPRLFAALAYRGDIPAGSTGALLSSLCVEPESQGTGLGRTLEENWRAIARVMGARAAFLTTDADDNEAVNRFYLSGGWGLHDQFVTRQGRRMNRFRYELTAAPEGERPK